MPEIDILAGKFILEVLWKKDTTVILMIKTAIDLIILIP